MKGFRPEYIDSLDKAEFKATLGHVFSFENPKDFNLDAVVDRQSDFKNYPEEEKKYFAIQKAKAKKEEKIKQNVEKELKKVNK